MSVEIPKIYNPQEVDKRWQQAWQESGCFHGDESSEKPGYSIVIPPPNVTGVLHLGHVLNNTLQDILARRARQEGKEVCWVPGTDHAGIATQVRVEKQLREQTGQSRHDLGREAFLEKIYQWKDKHGSIIIEQLKRLGCSCDWERERFTLDEEYSGWVAQVFTELFEQGLIYRGRRMVNWCPVSLTALSDEEVIMTPQRSQLYTMRYPVVGQENVFIEIATTRPETLMADVAVAVHPQDPRYQHLIGEKVLRPFPEAEIPVIAAEGVDPEFGTGALKITPAHDAFDYEVGVEQGLEVIDILTPDGKIHCPELVDLHGEDRFVARKLAAKKLDEMGLLVSQEDYENSVGISERAGVPVEPRLSMQWFLRYPALEEAIRVVKEGEIQFQPARWEKTYLNWLENIQDWCISRQLWWGHRIPVWYKKEQALDLRERPLSTKDAQLGDIFVGTNPPEGEEEWVQDEDVLDTWFSSWLWSFATMTDVGKESATLRKFHPTTDLVTGPDILFFWVARMIMATLHFRKELPFQHVFFTSIIRDLKGRKMSKSLGNSPDPLDLMDQYGADALRFGLLRIAPTGTDVRFDEKSVEEGRNFATKLWNSCRLRQMVELANVKELVSVEDFSTLPDVHLDILAKLDQLSKQLQQALTAYRFHDACAAIYEFFWSNYCDLFLEAIKQDLRPEADADAQALSCAVIDIVMKRLLALMQPFMPHLCEELAHLLGLVAEGEFLMQQELPKNAVLAEVANSTIEAAQKRSADLYGSAAKLRNLKAEYNLASNRNVVFVVAANLDSAVEKLLGTLTLLAGAKEVQVDVEYQAPVGTPVALTPFGQIYLPLEGMIDVESERKRLTKEIAKVEAELQRSEKKLGNEKFVANAKPEVVAQERERLQDWQQKLTQYRQLLEVLQ